MSRLAEFRAAEKALADQLAYLESLKNDAGLKKEIEFEEKLKSLLSSYGKSLKDIIAILDPDCQRGLRPRTVKPGRRARAIKVYKNPHTNEVVETKGGNHKVLKAWKAEFGNDAVESWLQP
ncbi:histone-like nucleoid-structuring protein, MvaT/MvaU family [Pseudomonas sp. DP-17]|uniref:histone-like nucleoid-structuring protein, MvaT/MvaU family n=1 Tax=Pseudomonas sp. DP-17 TaxID=1580486 RepID=UPI001EFBAA1E|nr:histone-like nucleoid-structuring protein, MvaT/MvaU family [Pseudomonas sp. DP-17]MCG8909883.1 DNA binding protein [Pseudomonas sp. DP-17]